MGHADSVTNDEHRSRSDIFDWSSSNPITQVIKVTLPNPTISLYNNLFIYTRIHSFHTSEASHMQLNASQRYVLCHEAAVASFKHEQRPTGVRRPAHEGLEAASHQTELGEKKQMSPVRPSPSLPPKQTGSSQPLPNPQNLHRRGGQRATRVGLSNDPGICRVAC